MNLLIGFFIIAFIDMTGVSLVLWQKKKVIQHLYENVSKESTEKEKNTENKNKTDFNNRDK